ncbi:unnamed protein product [Paramecium primaurelia]|uniref:Ubiquitin-conjugating enzyme/RWD-like protein n=1 Tax=Paramecium primaurelia TaxID=5886 RepID=A0A8S1MEF4_PARPR|nr:unnamed protein product [Paramecium primaurelia]
MFDNFIDQRIANEVDLLKRRKDRVTNQNQKDNYQEDEDDFDGYIQYTHIEHLKEFKQVRVGFEGKSLSEWKSALYYFIIEYQNYPIKPVIIKFPKEFRHQYIIQNTGIYCLPDLSERNWKRSTNLEQIINRVIQTFHEIPTYSDYPVDLSFVQISLNKEEYSIVIKTNKNCALNYTNKINEERQYLEQKKKQLENIEENLRKKKEEEQAKKQKELEEKQRQLRENEQKAIQNQQQQQFQKEIQQQQHFKNQNQIQQQQQFDQQQFINNRNMNPQIPYHPFVQMNVQAQVNQEQQMINQGFNPNYQQQHYIMQPNNQFQPTNYEQINQIQYPQPQSQQTANPKIKIIPNQNPNK